MKKFLGSFLAIALLMGIATPVKALTNYKTDDWQTTMPTDTQEEQKDNLSGKTVGTKTAEGSTTTIITGSAEENGMQYGPYVTGDGSTVKDGINEELSIALGTDKLTYGELFEISLSLKDEKYDKHFGYVNEVNVKTQNIDGTHIKVEVNGVGEVATITKSGIYKYSWNIKKNGDNTDVTFTLTNEEGKVEGKKQFDLETTFPVSGDIKKVTDKTTMRWLWFCNVKAAKVEVISKQESTSSSTTTPSSTPDTTVKVESKNYDQILKDSLKEEFGDRYGDNVNISVEVHENKKEDEKIKEEVSKKIENAKIVKYLDISIDVKDSANHHLDYIKKLTKPLDFSVEIPTDLPAVAKGYNRQYYIIRNHDGTIDIINPTLSADGKTLTFSTDSFSTYALAYNDSKAAPEKNVADASNPNTSDKIIPLAILLTISAGGISYLVKRRLFHKI